MNVTIHRVDSVTVEREDVYTGTFWIKIKTASDDGERNEITLFPVEALRDKSVDDIFGFKKADPA